jgi:hypothetical protein
MALIVLPEGTQVSGSIGGTTYARNRFGAYKRSRTVPVNPQSDAQVAARNRVANLSQAWSETLTANQRAAWDVYAAAVPWVNKLGQAVFITGFNHYVRSNAARLAAGLARVDDGPTTLELATPEGALAVTATEAGQTLSVTFDDAAAWCDLDGAFESVQMGIPQNPGRTFFGGPWRLCTPILGDSVAPPASPVAPAVPWPIAEGQRLWVRTRIGLPDGRLSGFAQVNFLAGA